MYKIALTGGIASGKTTLSKFLSNYKFVKCLNLDLAVHRLYESDYFLRKELTTRFGEKIIMTKQNGVQTVNRAELGKIVFSDLENLKSLNKIVHPRVFKYLQFEFETLEQMSKELKPDIVFIEGAVIIEAGWMSQFNEIWLTTLEKSKALDRVLTRDKKLKREQAERRINMQISDEERLKYAKFWYDTDPPFSENIPKIEAELQRLKNGGKLREISHIKNI